MTIEELFLNWGPWAFLVYITIKDILPLILNLVGKTVDTVIPAKAKEKQAQLIRETETEDRKIDLQEREVIALEQIGKSLVVIDTRLQEQGKNIDVILATLATANQALTVILDRIGRGPGIK